MPRERFNRFKHAIIPLWAMVGRGIPCFTFQRVMKRKKLKHKYINKMSSQKNLQQYKSCIGCSVFN